MKKLTLLLLSLSLTVVSTLSCQEQPAPPPSASEMSQHSVIMSNPELSSFFSLVKTANLLNFFQGTGPFTAFIPSNDAFAKFDQKTLEKLKEPQSLDQLIDLINYHIILGKHLSRYLKPGKYRTVNGKEITIRMEDGQIWVNDAKVTKADVVGPNGVGYVIDTVLVP